MFSKVQFAFILSLLSLTFGIQFEVENGVQRCLQSEYQPDTAYQVKIGIEPVDGSMSLGFILQTQYGQVVQQITEISDKTEFPFSPLPQMDVTYYFCFTDTSKYGSRHLKRLVSLILDEKDLPSFSGALRTRELQPIDNKIMRLETMTEKFKKNFEYLRQRERNHRDTTESTNARVLWLMLGSVVVVSGLAIIQMYYLRTYFKSKKLI